MITEEEYNKAKDVVNDYEEQLRIDDVMRREERKKAQKKREDECGKSKFGHDYRSSGGKWSSSCQQSCVDCGKTLYA